MIINSITMKEEEDDEEEKIDNKGSSDNSENVNKNSSNNTESRLIGFKRSTDVRISQKSSVTDIEKVDRSKKIKKSTSLQGRPAKANKELRKMEEQIKSAAWRMAELEENLYLVFGGAKVVFDDAHLIQAKVALSELYPSQILNIWTLIVHNWQQSMDTLYDPLGQEFVPISDKYYLNQFKEHGEIGNFIRLDVVFIVYTFQVFLRTDLEGFMKIAKMMKKVTMVVEPNENGILSAKESFHHDLIKSKIPELDDQMNVVYRLFYKVLDDTFNSFQGSNTLTIVANNYV